jgi:glycosyltransferase involved in cell wall biosynthesis
MKAPPLTIGLPVYNGERYLAEAIESILDQTFTDFTLIAADNASTDSTLEILEDFAGRDSRVVILRSEANRGAAWNYNRVVAECKGPFFKWAAADDLLDSTCVERSIERLETSPQTVVLAYPGTKLVDGEGNLIALFDDNLAAAPGAAAHTRFRRVIRNIVFGNAMFSVLRVDALRRTRLHGNFPSADQALLGELSLVGEFRTVEGYLFVRRLHEGASTQANATPESLAHWFEPGRTAIRWEAMSLFRQHLAGIAYADLPPRERALTYTAFLAAWMRRQLRPRTRFRRMVNRSGDEQRDVRGSST